MARNNLDISALQDASVSAFAGGDATVNAGGNVSGTLIGIDGINVTASSIGAALLSQSITASGDVTSSQIGFAPITAANAASQSESAESASQGSIVLADISSDENGPGKGKGEKPKLVSSGRVTVLPP